jgi:hypothetical protein
MASRLWKEEEEAKEKKQIGVEHPQEVSAMSTSLQGRWMAHKETGSGGGARKHRAWNNHFIITITRNQSRMGWPSVVYTLELPASFSACDCLHLLPTGICLCVHLLLL